MGFSNNNTLNLSSAPYVRLVDLFSAVRSLQRSLPRSPTPLSCPPNRRLPQTLILSNGSTSPPHTSSPLAVPFPSSATWALRSSARRKTPASRTRTSPKRPMKRALSQALGTGDKNPQPWEGSVGGQENSRSTIPAEQRRNISEHTARISYGFDIAAPVRQAFSQLCGHGTIDSPTTSSTSILFKCSDTFPKLDQASLGSPVTKRRSLHGSTGLGHDFSVSDNRPGPLPWSQYDVHDDSTYEFKLSPTSLSHESTTSLFTSMPRRSPSLRKSTLQQRHGEKTSWSRRRQAALALAAQQLASSGQQISKPVQTKTRPRLSLDQFMHPLGCDSPLPAQGCLPKASMHLLNQPINQPDQLSRTLTTSSSSTSIVDGPPTHFLVNCGEQPRPELTFPEALPTGALRPFAFEALSNNENVFATPNNYESIKPHPAAFASTGLISKFNRHHDEPQVVRGLAKGDVPDTPCKKRFASYPAPVPGSAIAKARHVRHSFKTPSTPFNPHKIQPVQSKGEKGSGVFGSALDNNGVTRSGSFLSLNKDGSGGLSDAKDILLGRDLDLSPLPTKQALAQYIGSPSNHRRFPGSTSAVGYGLTKNLTRTSSKLNLFTSPVQMTGHWR